jgi:hypothetical protein
MKSIISALLLFLLIAGCADTINEVPEEGIRITIRKPLDNDSLGVTGEKIEYDLTVGSGINFIELYLNDEFSGNYSPVQKEKPVINVNLDTSNIGKYGKIHLVYYDLNGSSVKSNSVKVYLTPDRSLPQKPYDISIVRINSSTVNISWKDTSKNINGYQIWRSDTPDGPFLEHLRAIASARNINDTVTAGSNYFYKLRGYSFNGFSEFSSVVNSGGSGGQSGLAAPGNLAASVKDLNVVELKWEDRCTGENYFKIERRREWSFFETIGFAQNNSTSFIDSGNGMLAGGEYYYRVKAVSSDDSSWSNETYLFMPPYVLKAPEITSIVNTSSRKVVLKWKDNDQNYASFVIERKEPSGSFTEAGRTDGSTRVFTDNILPNKYYYYRIKQDDNIYSSGYSEESGIQTNVIPLSTPLNLSGYFDGEAIVIRWEYAADCDSITIERKDPLPGSSYEKIASVGGVQKEFKDVSTECEKYYLYRIKSADAYSESAYSNETGITNWKICP